jgi:hypothetical protein
MCEQCDFAWASVFLIFIIFVFFAALLSMKIRIIVVRIVVYMEKFCFKIFDTFKKFKYRLSMRVLQSDFPDDKHIFSFAAGRLCR